MGKPRRLAYKYLFQLFRPTMAAIFLFPFTWGFAAGAEAARQLAWYKPIFAFLSFFFGSLFASSYNFYIDVDADRLHDDLYKDQAMSKQPFVTGEMGKWETRILFTGTIAACFGFAALVDWRFLIWMPATEILVLGLVYNHPLIHFKAKPAVDILTVAGAASLEMLSGWFIAARQWPAFAPLMWGFFFAATLYLPTVSNDVIFDREAGYRTSGVVYGGKRLMNAMFPSLFVLVAVAAANFLVGGVSWPWLLLVGFGTLFAFAYTGLIHWRWDGVHTRFNPWWLVGPVFAGTAFYLGVAIFMLAR
ncbi:MAG: UbiA family prenyltransferase [Candidatus Geothermincolia bacterium]